MFYGTYGLAIGRRGGVRQVAVPRIPQNRQQVPSERDESGAPCRYPGVVYWPSIDPCVRPTSALYQDNAAWKKYQQTGYLKIKGGVYQPPPPETEEKATVSLEVETVEPAWLTYAVYAGVAVSGAAALYFGYKFFTKNNG